MLDRTYEELVEMVIEKLPKDLKISKQAVECIAAAFADLVYEDAVFDTEFRYTTIQLLFDHGKKTAEDQSRN